MALSGSSFPLDHGGFITTVYCPNHYSHQRLMQALLSIVPDAGEPPATAVSDGGPPCSTHPDAPHGFDRNGSHSADRYMCDCEGWQPSRDPEQDDDEGLPADFTQCRAGGGCE